MFQNPRPAAHRGRAASVPPAHDFPRASRPDRSVGRAEPLLCRSLSPFPGPHIDDLSGYSLSRPGWPDGLKNAPSWLDRRFM